MGSHISEISHFKSPDDILGYLIRVLSSLWTRRLNAVLIEIDLTEMQFVVLMAVGWRGDQPDGLTQAEMCDFCRISTALGSQVLASLVAKKLVSVKPKPNDGRAKVVVLTRAGRGKLAEAVQILEVLDRSFWSRDPARVKRLKTDIQAVIAEASEVGEANVEAPVAKTRLARNR